MTCVGQLHQHKHTKMLEKRRWIKLWGGSINLLRNSRNPKLELFTAFSEVLPYHKPSSHGCIQVKFCVPPESNQSLSSGIKLTNSSLASSACSKSSSSSSSAPSCKNNHDLVYIVMTNTLNSWLCHPINSLTILKVEEKEKHLQSKVYPVPEWWHQNFSNKVYTYCMPSPTNRIHSSNELLWRSQMFYLVYNLYLMNSSVMKFYVQQIILVHNTVQWSKLQRLKI